MHNFALFCKTYSGDFEIFKILKHSIDEFNWYGEWFLKCKLIPLYYTKGKVITFWKQEQYDDARKKGKTVDDFIKEGYFAILMQNRWVNSHIYENPTTSRISKVIKNIIEKVKKIIK